MWQCMMIRCVKGLTVVHAAVCGTGASLAHMQCQAQVMYDMLISLLHHCY